MLKEIGNLKTRNYTISKHEIRTVGPNEKEIGEYHRIVDHLNHDPPQVARMDIGGLPISSKLFFTADGFIYAAIPSGFVATGESSKYILALLFNTT